MNVALSYNLSDAAVTEIRVTGSKSESNRLLVLRALFPTIAIENLSQSDDTTVLSQGIIAEKGTVDVHHAGTAMRFLTAFFAVQEGKEILLTGSDRMKDRPIGILVDALNSLGAHITYEDKEGYPPLRILGKKITKDSVQLKANVSSQYISALMLIAPTLPNGLTISLEGEITSVPYISMTLNLLKQAGIEGNFDGNVIRIASCSSTEALGSMYSESIKPQTLVVESDWSSASYFYSIMALSDLPSLSLHSYKENSLQWDSALMSIYKKLGVSSSFNESENTITLIKEATRIPLQLELDLINTPDIAQTIVVTCFGLGMGCTLTGLRTLKIKETDRLQALQNELEKLGANVEITSDSLQLFPASKISEGIEIETYNDHRMAMAFAPLAIVQPLTIRDSGVVSKSFPTYWEDLQSLGFKCLFK